jgi:hypothetical protein
MKRYLLVIASVVLLFGCAGVNQKAEKSKSQGTALQDERVLVYEPSLLSLLCAKEKEKGAPLTDEEVGLWFYCGTVVKLTKPEAALLEQKRGYPDLNPHDMIDAQRLWKIARLDRDRCNKANQALVPTATVVTPAADAPVAPAAAAAHL